MADLSHLARQAATHVGFVAYHLAAYQEAKHLDDGALAMELDCSLDDLVHLRLCALPRFDHLEEDIQRIAQHTHASPAALAQVLRD